LADQEVGRVGWACYYWRQELLLLSLQPEIRSTALMGLSQKTANYRFFLQKRQNEKMS
jgi:hypothetical protein